MVVAYVSACQPATQPTPEPIHPAVELYLRRLLDTMEANSIHRKTIDWAAFRKEILEKASGAQSNAATYPAIQRALTRLNDEHSLFVTPAGQVYQASGAAPCPAGPAATPPADSTLGYVRVPAFGEVSPPAMTAFAETIQNTISKADRPVLRGWIVDLRGNTGGNMWPMLAGVGPLLGDGVVGYFIDPDGTEFPWSYENGNALLNGSPLVATTFYRRVSRSGLKVAVLTDGATASSGEALAIAFRERPNTRSFGSATCGKSTANANFSFTDGSRLVLTVSVMADRTRKTYGKRVVPDVVDENPDSAFRRAVEWLNQ